MCVLCCIANVTQGVRMASFVQLLASHDTHSRFTELLQLLLVQCSYNNRTSGLGNKPCVPIMRVTGAPQYYPAPNVNVWISTCA